MKRTKSFWPYGCLSTSIIFLAMLTITGCQLPQPEWTPSEHDYIVKAEAQPTSFTLPKAEAKDAWGRAQSFLAKYSDTKIVTATDYVLQTDLGIDFKQFTYKASLTPRGDSATFEMECDNSSPLVALDRSRNEHVWAYYAVTGNEPPTNRIVLRDN